MSIDKPMIVIEKIVKLDKTPTKRSKKRDMILAQAAVLFNERGPRATTLSDVTTALGMTKSSLYYYVKSKDDLAYQCFLESCERLKALVEHAASHCAEGQFLQTLFTSFIEEWHGVLRGEKLVFAILNQIKSLKGDMRKDIEDRYTGLVVMIRDKLNEESQNNLIYVPDTLATAHAFFSTMQWIATWYKPSMRDEALKASTDILSTGMVPNGHNVEDAILAYVRKTKPFVIERRDTSEEKQEVFIRRAIKLFNDKGYRATSLDEISQSLSVTKGAFYHHWDNKEELLYRCFDYSFQVFDMLIKKVQETDESGMRQLYMLLMNLYATQNIGDGPIIRSDLMMAVDPKRQKQLSKRYKLMSDQIGAIIRRGMQDKSIRGISVDIVKNMLMGIIYAGDEYGRWRPIENIEESAALYMRFLTRGVQVR